MSGPLDVLPATVEIAPTLADAASVAPSPGWSLPARIAFRFSFLYFGLYITFTQMLGSLIMVPVIDVPEIGALAPMRNVVSWTAAHVFGVTAPLVITGSGSGDKTFDWVEAWCLLMLAVAGTIAWSVVDRKRPHYESLHKWFRLFLRFALGGTLANYGAIKIIPAQMPAPSLIRLIEPFGDSSPMGVLWSSIGASAPYERFAGSIEMMAGILLFIPSLATLGALMCLAATLHVFVLNMAYDVPVKLFSFHLILMTLVLLAPDASRLARVLVLNRGVGPASEPPLVYGRRAQRVLLIGQLVFGAYLAGLSLWNARTAWFEWSTGSPRSPLYGIWDVEDMSIDGQVRPPLTSDRDRWRRVVFDSPAFAGVQSMDNTLSYYGSTLDAGKRTLTLSRADDESRKSRLTFERSTPSQLILDGEVNGRKVRMQLHRFDEKKLLLLGRGFHWVQEYPFNR